MKMKRINAFVLFLVYFCCGAEAELHQYKVYTECGGNLGFPSGIITSPNYPDNYPNDSRCFWYIHAPTGQVIDFRFRFLDLEIGDTVKIYNGHIVQEDFCIGTYSGLKNGTELSNTFVRSAGNTLTVSFIAKGATSNKGFISNYWTHECLPYTYGPVTCNITCKCIPENSLGCDSVSGMCQCKAGWSQKDCSQAVCYRIATQCQYDCHVTSTNPWKEECFCPKRMRTIGNSTQGSCTEYHECYSDVTETSGYLSNPPYPINVRDCYWRIVTAPGSVVSLSFSMEVHWWHIHCGYSFVTIIDEATINKPTSKICVATKGEIQTSSNVMKIIFNGYILNSETMVFSGRFNSLSCPKFHWGLNNCHTKCHCVIENSKYCNTENGRCVCKDGFSSHDCSFGNVPSTSCAVVTEREGNLEKHGGISCWLIHGVGIKFNTRNIVGHYLWNTNTVLLNVYDGNSNASLRLGGYKDTFLKANGTEMYIESLVPSDYFILSYTTQSSVCGGTMISSSGHISSPQYPQRYPDYSDCQWTIVVNETNFISLRIIDLKLEQEANCNNDYLDIYNGSSNTAVRIGHFCNSPVPIIINSTSNFMYIVFHSDRSIAERGFHADFQAVGCPHHWGKECIPSCQCEKDHTLYCNINIGECVCKPGWTGYKCEIKVDLCSSDSCPGNTSCETEDGIMSCRSCNVNISSESGYIWSPSINQKWGSKFCFWTIYGASSSVVTLSFQEFNFPNPLVTSVYWEVSVYDGNSSNSPLLGIYRDEGATGIVRSSQNKMHVALSYSNHEGRGLLATFSTHACNPFTYGKTCQYQCICESNNTRLCDDLTGLCVCKEPWFGDRCTLKIDPCLLQDIAFKCPKDTVCIQKDDMHSCVCRQGFVMNKSQQCEEQVVCIRNRELCSHFCVIDSLGKEKCTCPLNMVLGEDKLTCVVPFYPHGSEANDFSLPLDNKSNAITYKKVNLELAVPYGNHLHDSLFVTSNGAVSFDKVIPIKEPSMKKALELKINIIAPFWANINSKKGATWFNFYTRCGDDRHRFRSQIHEEIYNRASKDIKTFFHLGDFDVQTVSVFTWIGIMPQVKEENETTSFQLIFVSGYEDGAEFAIDSYDSPESAYALMIYNKDKFNWIYKKDRPIVFGYTTAGGEHFNIDADKLINILPEETLEDSGLKGVWAFKVGSVSSAAQKCQRYTCHHSALLSNAKYQADIKDLHRCPCDTIRLGRQWEEHYPICSDGYYCTSLKKVAMNILFPNNARNMLCSYKGHLIANKPYTGHILISSDPNSEENKFNHVSHDWCCVQSNKAALCSRFHSIFPDMGCSNTVPFISATALGDPHFTTLDNFSYTMNGWGEYILMDVQARKFMLQCRTDIVKNENGTMTKATAFVAFAAKEGSSPTFQVQLSPDKTTMVIMANESDITKDFYGSLNYTMITDTIDIRRDNSLNRTQVVAVFPCGVALVIEVVIENLKVEVEVDTSLKGLTRGLLGNFNGNPYDDYQLPDGTVLSANITEEQIFELFASSYQVNEQNSVFKYENGKQMVDYHHFDFIPTFTSSFSLKKIKEAEELCGFANQECIYDFIITENETFAMSTKMFKESHQIKVEKLGNTLPEVKILNSTSISNNRWFVLENEVNILIVEASDQDGDVTSMALIEDGGENFIFHKNGTLIYTPKIQEPVLIGVIAKDSKNASSAIMFIEITVCPTCNGHGKYDKEIFSENEYLNGYFSTLKCLCYPPYTG